MKATRFLSCVMGICLAFALSACSDSCNQNAHDIQVFCFYIGDCISIYNQPLLICY